MNKVQDNHKYFHLGLYIWRINLPKWYLRSCYCCFQYQVGTIIAINLIYNNWFISDSYLIGLLADDRPIVKTKNGLIRGTFKTSKNNLRQFAAFEGIPYAQPPTGNLRFEV